ncbi:MAG: bifunctional 4-hydroxy-2-oxoglutarate aldolase/2-dehydro-3-deoxy-phosphogluconate aldolase [Oscillospiraceae bacterium]|nr:bifunctional 4-hydroxy-2-oxoglutarate aldolase/2-dehydro-3-deoxy-phosphogluconate aldolase [Oscillospiraceae bacterium]
MMSRKPQRKEYFMDIFQKLKRNGIIPVLALDDAGDALPLAKALLGGGVSCAEFTFSSPAAEAALSNVAKALPEMLIGASDVLTAKQAECAANAGAKFISSPGLVPEIVEFCLKRELPVIVGVSTASDVIAASNLGLDVVKFFPAEACGGLCALKALSAPFPAMRFIPCGGIDANNLNDYLKCECVIACGGDWMIDKTLLAAKDFDGIGKLAKEAVDAMLAFEFAHLGVNEINNDEADKTARFFCDAFSFEYIPREPSIFSGAALEIMRNGGKGKNGHIGFFTDNVERAVFRLEARGYSFDPSTARIDADNERTFIYFDGEYGGFAVHLIQR